MTQSSDAPSANKDKAPAISIPKLDLLTIGAIAGAVFAIYGLWWSRDRVLARGPETAADQDAIVLAGLFLLLGLCIALLVKRLANVESDLPFVLILFLPMIAFLVLAGKITDLNAGATGIQLTLSTVKVPTVAAQNIGVGVAEFATPPAEEPWCAPDEFASQAPQQAIIASAPEPTVTIQGNPVYLTIRMGTCTYSMKEIADAIEKNRYNDEFRFVILLDSNDVFQAFMDSLTARELFSCKFKESEGGECLEWSYPTLADAINNFPETPFAIRGFPGIELDTISEGATNISALKEMKRQGLDALIVKDKDGHVTGILKLDQVLGTMMIELASPAPGP
jgi:hypothetical protein